jgi:hypothetical protein
VAVTNAATSVDTARIDSFPRQKLNNSTVYCDDSFDRASTKSLDLLLKLLLQLLLEAGGWMALTNQGHGQQLATLILKVTEAPLDDVQQKMAIQ